MKSFLLTLVLLVAILPNASAQVFLSGGHAYVLASVSDYAQARAVAAASGGYVACPTDFGESFWIHSDVLQSTMSAFIGLTDEAVEGTWVWESGEPLGFTFWGGNGPSSQDHRDYARINSSAAWSDVAATGAGAAVLEFPTLPQPQVVATVDRNDRQYLAISVLSIADARLQAHALGGSLVSMDDPAENAWVHQNFAAQLPAYIGLSDERNEGTWQYDNGEPLSFSYWAISQPGQASAAHDYVSLQSNGDWYDTTAQGPGYAIVERLIPPYVPPTTLTDDLVYVEDFESGPRGWSTPGSLWELGTPAQQHLSAAASGTKAWMTDLDGDPVQSMDEWLLSPVFDFSALANDPVLSFQIALDCSGLLAGCRAEIDLGDGNGFRVLGSSATWYWDSWSSSAYPFSGPVWKLTWNWGAVQHRLDGAAGRSNVQIRIRFATGTLNADPNLPVNREGAAIDDVVIRPVAPGTQTTLGDDLAATVRIDTLLALGSVIPLDPGESVELAFDSPGGNLLGEPSLLLAEAFPTGQARPLYQVGFFNEYGGAVAVSDDAFPVLLLPLGPLQPGSGTQFTVPVGLAGLSITVQGFTLSPSLAANGLYATSDAVELRFR